MVDMMTQPTLGPTELVALLREQDELYATLEQVADRQRVLVSEADIKPLLLLLADRQRLSGRLKHIADRLEPVRSQWSEVRGRLSPAQRTEVDSLVADLRERVRRLMTSDEQDARVLAARRESTAAELRRMNDSRMALSAYGSPVPRAGRLDRWDQTT